jgi:hypothetical protein
LLLALCLLIYVAACSALPLLVPSVLSQRLLILLAVSARLIRVAACSAVLSRCFILLLSCVDARSWRALLLLLLLLLALAQPCCC